ncbi:hypothetical protein TNCV_4172411 [Trichonephila clavipes]|nr:hypothetical protein TNCV_4172411 [Trichonephila clavipes]
MAKQKELTAFFSKRLDLYYMKTTSSPQTGKIRLPVLELNDVQNHISVRISERLKSKHVSVNLTGNVPNSYFEAENSANWHWRRN